MSIASFEQSKHNHPLFSLSTIHKKNSTKISMQLSTHIVNTRDLPNTVTILKRELPSVLQSQCFNEYGLPFRREVRSTEIGHLFEHILLEYLCVQKLAIGSKNAVYSGVTNWNWKKEAWGSFHIEISAGYDDLPIFERAFIKSIDLLGVIMQPAMDQRRYQQYFSAPISMITSPIRLSF